MLKSNSQLFIFNSKDSRRKTKDFRLYFSQSENSNIAMLKSNSQLFIFNSTLTSSLLRGLNSKDSRRKTKDSRLYFSQRENSNIAMLKSNSQLTSSLLARSSFSIQKTLDERQKILDFISVKEKIPI
jgi:hypothetical protein